MRLFLECKPDETLAVALGVKAKDITHCHGKGRVSKYLAKHSGVTGMVDEDPNSKSAEPLTLRRFVESGFEHDVRFKVEKTTNNRLVVICPRLEPWLIKTARDARLKLSESGLSDDLSELDAIINHRLRELEAVLAELLKARSPRLLHLKSLLGP